MQVFSPFGAYFFQTQFKIAVVVTEKPLLGSVNKVLPLPVLYYLHRVEDDATNRVTFDYCEIVHKNISSSNCVKKDNTGQVTCLKLEREGGRACWLMISAKLLLRIFKTKDDAALAPPPPPPAYSFTVF